MAEAKASRRIAWVTAAVVTVLYGALLFNAAETERYGLLLGDIVIGLLASIAGFLYAQRMRRRWLRQGEQVEAEDRAKETKD